MRHALMALLSALLRAQDPEPFPGGLRYVTLDVPENHSLVDANDQGDCLFGTAAGLILREANGTAHSIPLKFTAALNNYRQVLANVDGNVVFWQPGDQPVILAYGGYAWGMNNSLQIAGEVDRDSAVWLADSGWQRLTFPILHPYLVNNATFNKYSARAFSINDTGYVIGTALHPILGQDWIYLRVPGGLFRLLGNGAGARFVTRAVISNSLLILATNASATTSSTSILLDAQGRVLHKPSKPLRSMSGNGRLFVVQSERSTLAVACDTRLEPPEVNVPLSGGTVRVRVTAADDCEWDSRQRGSAEITIEVPPNPSPVTIRRIVGGRELVIRQGGGTCDFAVPGDIALASADGGTFRVSVRTASECEWSVSTDTPWIRPGSAATYTGSQEIEFSFDSNPDRSNRSGVIVIADVRINAYQEAHQSGQ